MKTFDNNGNEMTHRFRDTRLNTTEKNEMLLRRIGAQKNAPGIWMLGNWHLYPKKCFAMHRYNSKFRLDLYKFIQMEMEKENVGNKSIPIHWSSELDKKNRKYNNIKNVNKIENWSEKVKRRIQQFFHILLQ